MVVNNEGYNHSLRLAKMSLITIMLIFIPDGLRRRALFHGLHFCQSLASPIHKQRVTMSMTEIIVSPCSQCLWLVVLSESEANQLPTRVSNRHICW